MNERKRPIHEKREKQLVGSEVYAKFSFESQRRGMKEVGVFLNDTKKMSSVVQIPEISKRPEDYPSYINDPEGVLYSGRDVKYYGGLDSLEYSNMDLGRRFVVAGFKNALEAQGISVTADLKDLKDKLSALSPEKKGKLSSDILKFLDDAMKELKLSNSKRNAKWVGDWIGDASYVIAGDSDFHDVDKVIKRVVVSLQQTDGYKYGDDFKSMYDDKEKGELVEWINSQINFDQEKESKKNEKKGRRRRRNPRPASSQEIIDKVVGLEVRRQIHELLIFCNSGKNVDEVLDILSKSSNEAVEDSNNPESLLVMIRVDQNQIIDFLGENWREKIVSVIPAPFRKYIKEVVLVDSIGKDGCVAGQMSSSGILKMSVKHSGVGFLYALMHETGHAIDISTHASENGSLSPQQLAIRRKFLEIVSKEEQRFSIYAANVSTGHYIDQDGTPRHREDCFLEDFAESFSLFFTAPDLLRAMAPMRFKFFEEIVAEYFPDINLVELREKIEGLEKDIFDRQNT